MQLHTRSLLTSCRQQYHTHQLTKPLSAASGRARLLISCARSRKSASPAPQDDSGEADTSETAPAAAPVPLVRSSRRSAATGRNLRGSSPRKVASPVQQLRDKGLIATNEEGQEYVNIACLGEGQPHWYSLALLENKEDTYISLLTKKLEEYGYTICPTMYQPFVPEAAAESNAEAAAAAEAAVSDAYARADDAQQWYEEARGGPGEAGAAARLKEAEAAVAAAEKLVSEIRDAGVAAERAAVASVPLLEQYDVVFWKPRKKMMVYSHNTDQLVERQVAFSRGTGGATLLVHCRLDPLLADVFANTYYFLDWRSYTPVSAVLLNQHDMLPDGADLEDVFKLPEPCTEGFLLQVSTWQHTRESEDLEAERKEYYGSGAGSPFGARPEKGTFKSDPNNPSRWSVSAGPTNAGAAALIAAGQPLPWEQEQQQEEGFGRGRGRGRNSRGARGGRGGRGGERQPQQQQEFGQPQQQGFREQGFRHQGSRGGYDSYQGGYDSWEGGRGRGQGRARGRGRQQEQQQWRQQDDWQQQQQQRPQQQRGHGYAAAVTPGEDDLGAEDGFSEQNRQRQMDYMNEMGGSRYRDGGDYQQRKQQPRQQQQQQQRGNAGAAWQQDRFNSLDSEQNRQQQMAWMDEMGGSRYKDSQQQQDEPLFTSEGYKGWPNDEQAARRQQQQQQQQRAGAGRDGGTTRMRQLDFTGDMGSDRYSDDEDRMDYDRLEGLDGTQQGPGWQQQQQQQLQHRGLGAGKDNGATMQRQLGFMAEMGSDRYSDDDDDISNVAPRGGSRSSSANFSGLLSDVADALDYMDTGLNFDDWDARGTETVSQAWNLPRPLPKAGGATSRNNAAAGRLDAGKASYMDEDSLEWGRDAEGDVGMGGDDEGSAAAKALLQEWQSEGQPGKGGKGNAYNADVSTRSREGLGASFEYDAGPGLASADSLLGQLPDAESLAGLQQQQQQEPPAAAAAPKPKGRASTASRRAKKSEDAAGAADGAAAPAAASSRRKTSTRKAAGTTKQQKRGAAAADVPLDGWVGGADASDEGFEEGWVDRMMDDGNNRAGIDDVLRS